MSEGAVTLDFVDDDVADENPGGVARKPDGELPELRATFAGSSHSQVRRTLECFGHQDAQRAGRQLRVAAVRRETVALLECAVRLKLDRHGRARCGEAADSSWIA